MQAVSDQPESRRTRPEPDGGRVRISPGPVVEPCRGSAGHRPRASDWAIEAGFRLPSDRAGHGGRKGPGAAEIETRLSGRDHRGRQPPGRKPETGRPGTPAVVDGLSLDRSFGK